MGCGDGMVSVMKACWQAGLGRNEMKPRRARLWIFLLLPMLLIEN